MVALGALVWTNVDEGLALQSQYLFSLRNFPPLFQVHMQPRLHLGVVYGI